MKYIRTKDKIIDFGHLTDFTKARITEINEKEHSIIKFADTIEELCDVLVYKQPKYLPQSYLEKPIYYFKDKSWLNSFIEKIKNGYEYYGAIWTDKGLIYVAKMNEKGEFELL